MLVLKSLVLRLVEFLSVLFFLFVCSDMKRLVSQDVFIINYLNTLADI